MSFVFKYSFASFPLFLHFLPRLGTSISRAVPDPDAFPCPSPHPETCATLRSSNCASNVRIKRSICVHFRFVFGFVLHTHLFVFIDLVASFVSKTIFSRAPLLPICAPGQSHLHFRPAENPRQLCKQRVRGRRGKRRRGGPIAAGLKPRPSGAPGLPPRVHERSGSAVSAISYNLHGRHQARFRLFGGGLNRLTAWLVRLARGKYPEHGLSTEF